MDSASLGLQAATLLAFVVGGVLLGFLNYRFVKSLSRRDFRRSSYVDMLNGILDLKSWAMHQKSLMRSVRSYGTVEDLVEQGVVSDEQDLMAKCILFYRAEKLYHLSTQGRLDDVDRQSLEREIQLWLDLEGMCRFFVGFCETMSCHSPEFMGWVREYYSSRPYASECFRDRSG